MERALFNCSASFRWWLCCCCCCGCWCHSPISSAENSSALDWKNFAIKQISHFAKRKPNIRQTKTLVRTHNIAFEFNPGFRTSDKFYQFTHVESLLVKRCVPHTKPPRHLLIRSFARQSHRYLSLCATWLAIITVPFVVLFLKLWLFLPLICRVFVFCVFTPWKCNWILFESVGNEGEKRPLSN